MKQRKLKSNIASGVEVLGMAIETAHKAGHQIDPVILVMSRLIRAAAAGDHPASEQLAAMLQRITPEQAEDELMKKWHKADRGKRQG